MHTKSLLYCAFAGTLISSCAMGPDFQRPEPKTPTALATMPDTKALDAANAQATSVPVPEAVESRWWDCFSDPILSGLVTRSIAKNLDVHIAIARVAQSRAQLGVTNADLYPQINGNASYTRQLESQKGVIGLISGGGNPATQTNGTGGTMGGAVPSSATGTSLPPFNLFQYGFDATWELDLWGRVRRQAESAGAQLEAAMYTRRDTLVSTAAEVAKDYLQLRGAQENTRITRDNLQSFQRTADLTREQANAGLATELDVANAQAQVYSTAANLPQLEQQAAQLINAIGLLLAEQPGALKAELAPEQAVPSVPPRVPVGLPSELVQRRPDIREAEANLHAATASIGAAKADFFPKVTLSGSFAIQAVSASDLGNWAARSWSFGPGLTVPIFDGHRLHAQLLLREAQQQEAAISYQKAVLSAFREVDDALASYGYEQARRDQLDASVIASKRALDLAQKRYAQGLSDYLQVLVAQRTLLANQRQLADSTTTITTDLVSLYKALGGGWEAGEDELRKQSKDATAQAR